MLRAEQGSILRVDGIKWPVIVVSNDHFNEIGEAIVCPILDFHHTFVRKDDPVGNDISCCNVFIHLLIPPF